MSEATDTRKINCTEKISKDISKELNIKRKCVKSAIHRYGAKKFFSNPRKSFHGLSERECLRLKHLARVYYGLNYHRSKNKRKRL